MPDRRHERGLIDTSVVIDLPFIEETVLPRQVAMSAITLAELAAGPHVAADLAERARRQARLQQAEVTVETLPFSADAAVAYGLVYAAVAGAGRKARGRRALDLLIAATAVAARRPLYTRNPDDFAGLEDVLEVVAVPAGGSVTA